MCMCVLHLHDLVCVACVAVQPGDAAATYCCVMCVAAGHNHPAGPGALLSSTHLVVCCPSPAAVWWSALIAALAVSQCVQKALAPTAAGMHGGMISLAVQQQAVGVGVCASASLQLPQHVCMCVAGHAGVVTPAPCPLPMLVLHTAAHSCTQLHTAEHSCTLLPGP